MTTRRDVLGLALGTAGLLSVGSTVAQAPAAKAAAPLLMRAIPKTGEKLPLIGLGSSATFAQVARTEDHAALKAVFEKMNELGGTLFDTAPSYGASEEVSGRIAQELNLQKKLFWATKLNVARGGQANAAEAREQLETSFKRIGKPVIDLIQIHNMGDIKTQLPILKEFKQQGRIRYLGITTTFENQYADLIATMRSEPLDFIGTDYAIDGRYAEEVILPLAQERGIAVLCYAPFGRTRLWNRVAGHTVPDWAREFDASSWAQFFLKYVASHPAITVVTPATSRASNMADNMGAAVGRLPDAAQRKRMVEFIEGLPRA